MAMNGHDARAAKDVVFSVFSFRAMGQAVRDPGRAAGPKRGRSRPATGSPLARSPVAQRLTALRRPRRAGERSPSELFPVLRIGGCGSGQAQT